MMLGGAVQVCARDQPGQHDAGATTYAAAAGGNLLVSMGFWRLAGLGLCHGRAQLVLCQERGVGQKLRRITGRYSDLPS